MPNMGVPSAEACSGLHVQDAYARVSSPMAQSGAAFMILHNHGETADRLVAARSDVAARVELHTHVEEDGVMRMIEVVEGIPLPADGGHVMARGGDHVMFLGLARRLADGDSVSVTLVYESGCKVSVEIPVDLKRGAPGGHSHAHGHRH
ncbi:MAG: copper chaperone PCu(A)C [Rhodobacteraceae bacterium]|nr:copper chaperone PCu(A)C [Paracoccaceae bacterium]